MDEKEKTEFVSGKFLVCLTDFGDFKKDEHYWLEYVGNNMYVGRSDNILNKRFNISESELQKLFG